MCSAPSPTSSPLCVCTYTEAHALGVDAAYRLVHLCVQNLHRADWKEERWMSGPQRPLFLGRRGVLPGAIRLVPSQVCLNEFRECQFANHIASGDSVTYIYATEHPVSLHCGLLCLAWGMTKVSSRRPAFTTSWAQTFQHSARRSLLQTRTGSKFAISPACANLKTPAF